MKTKLNIERFLNAKTDWEEVVGDILRVKIQFGYIKEDDEEFYTENEYIIEDVKNMEKWIIEIENFEKKLQEFTYIGGVDEYYKSQNLRNERVEKYEKYICELHSIYISDYEVMESLYNSIINNEIDKEIENIELK